LLSGAGLVDEALRYVDSAAENSLDPFDAERYRKSGYTDSANVTDPAEAVRSAKKVLVLFPNHIITLYGLVQNNARIGNYIEAERYLERLKLSDTDGVWAYAGQLILSGLKGELPRNSQALDLAMANPKASNQIKGVIYFIVNDVEKGIAAWREMEAGLVHLLWKYQASREDTFDQRVLDDPRYQALMEDFGLGKRWRAYLLAQTAQLADITGIPVTTTVETPELRFIARFGGDSVSTSGGGGG
jgi:tetratricopeptide (TPR) repeat protein